MGDNDAPIRMQQDPTKVWDELDDYTRNRVIEMFADMAFRAVVTNGLASRKSFLSEEPTERTDQTPDEEK
jgi:hypothetical protein